jgi:hypothetical protein
MKMCKLRTEKGFITLGPGQLAEQHFVITMTSLVGPEVQPVSDIPISGL